MNPIDDLTWTPFLIGAGLWMAYKAVRCFAEAARLKRERLTMTNEQFARYPAVLAPDPRCPTPRLERVVPGDVLDDGSIVTANGSFRTRGSLYVDGRQADAAAYYGWTIDRYVPATGLYVVRK